MDSITHLFYGGVIAAAIAPKQHRRAALLAGMALNTLPDLDVLPLMFSDDPVVRMTWHRGATHSWLVLPFVAWALWAFFRTRGGRVAAEPRRWWWVIFACLMAHPLLDSFTVYGTQLLWPLPMRPLMWSSLFIVDPLFTLPWLLAFVVAWFARDKRFAQHALVAGIVAGSLYVGCSLLAKFEVERAATRALAGTQFAHSPRFSTPTAFNILLWRVVVATPSGHLAGERSLFDKGPMHFTAYQWDRALLDQAARLPAGARLIWFSNGFEAARDHGGVLLLEDLRMGSDPEYLFRFAVARRVDQVWQAIPPRQGENGTAQMIAELRRVWRRIWDDAAVTGATQAAAKTSGTTSATSASK